MARQTRKDKEDEARAGRRVNRKLNRTDRDRKSYDGPKKRTTSKRRK